MGSAKGPALQLINLSTNQSPSCAQTSTGYSGLGLTTMSQDLLAADTQRVCGSKQTWRPYRLFPRRCRRSVLPAFNSHALLCSTFGTTNGQAAEQRSSHLQGFGCAHSSHTSRCVSSIQPERRRSRKQNALNVAQLEPRSPSSGCLAIASSDSKGTV